jgi:hypothetical protein
MNVSAPAHGSSLAPVIPLAPLVGSNAAETIPFQNVLDALEAFNAPNDDNVWGEPSHDSQGAPLKKDWPEPATAPQQQAALQYVAPQVPFVPVPELPPLTTTSADPTEPADAPQESTTQETPVPNPIAQPAGDVAIPSTRSSAPAPAMDSKPLEISQVTLPYSQRASSQTSAMAPAAAITNRTARPATELETSPDNKTQTIEEPGLSIEPAPQTVLPLPSSTAASVAFPEGRPVNLSDNKPAVAVPITPQDQETPVAKSVSPDTTPPKPEITTQSSKPAPVPSVIRDVSARDRSAIKERSPIARAPSKEVFTLPVLPAQTIPIVQPTAPPTTPTAQVLASPAKLAMPSTQVSTPPARVAPTITDTPPSVSTPQPLAPSPKPKEMRLPHMASPGTSVEAPTQAARTADESQSREAVTQISPAPIPVPVAEPAAVASELPVAPIRSRSEVVDAAIAPAPNIPLPATNENLAFTVQMLPAAPAPVHEQSTLTKPAVTPPDPPATQPTPAVTLAKATSQVQPENTNTSNSRRETQSPDPVTDKTNSRVTKSPDLPEPRPTRISTTQWSEVSVPRPSETNSPSPELGEQAHASSAPASQDTHVVLPELPKAPTSTDILLRLNGNDHSPAAIRVAERAGSVNVSVHAADPGLRESLRSNLGELSSQLNGQGWKAEVTKPETMAAQSENQQDSHGGREGSPQQQQQTFGGDRQPQRDRRTPGQWQQELEQHTSSGDARPGGTR